MPTKFAHTTNLSMHIPTKFYHKTKLYTCQQIFHIHHDFVQPSLHNKFFTISKLPKFKPKFIQQTSYITNIAKTSQFQSSQNSNQNSSNNITNYQHCQNSISHQHCPNYTMTKNTTRPKCSKAKIKFQQDHTIK